MEVNEIIKLMQAMSETGTTGLSLEENQWKLTLKREKKEFVISKDAVKEQESAADSLNHNGLEKRKTDENSEKMVRCPLVGTFYSSPSPDAEDFVKVGDSVKKGQVLGIVEAMKLMNEIESEYDGIVEEILVENETTVEYGQPLFKIR